ncbi:MAG: hypothetical protein ACXWU1_07465 [Allosphingosinicella sp.]
MIKSLALAALVLAAQPINEQEATSTFSDRQPVRLAPLPAATAFAAFQDICMATFPDPAAFEGAAAASALGFVRNEDPERGALEWTSSHGQITLLQAPNRERAARRDRREGRGSRQRWTARCDFWFAIAEQPDPDALVAAIGAQLAPQVRPREEILGISWALEPRAPGTALKLVYLPSTDDARLFTLSLQQLADIPPG